MSLNTSEEYVNFTGAMDILPLCENYMHLIDMNTTFFVK